ncbi:MAG: hypothetical protein IJR17_06060 [Clostridia bacterium]|nr:hypothetical protein [Clostridia bacterium]
MEKMAGFQSIYYLQKNGKILTIRRFWALLAAGADIDKRRGKSYICL